MITAFLFVTADREHLRRLGPRLAACPGVVEVHTTTGKLDFIVKIQVPDQETLAVLVHDELASLPGIVRTRTHLAMRRYTPEEIAVAYDLGLD